MASNSRKARRTRVAEGIYTEGGSWIAIFRDQDGRQRSKTLPHVRNLTEAKKARRTLLADLEAKRIAPASRETVADAADAWLQTRHGRVRERTLEADRRGVGYLKRYFGNRRMQDVSPSDI